MQQTLTLSGLLSPDGDVDLRPGYLRDRQPEDLKGDRLVSQGHPELVVEVLDADGNPVVRQQIASTPICTDQVAERSPRLILGRVPVPEDAAIVRVLVEREVAHEFRIPEARPEVTVTWNPPPEPTGTSTITWDASHADGAELEFMVGLEAEAFEAPQPVSLGLRDMSVDVNLDDLPAGRCRFLVAATNGGRTTVEPTDWFEVPPRPPLVTITSPIDGDTVAIGQSVVLAGHAIVQAAGLDTPALTWESSADGTIGSGSVVETDRLSAGEHTITARGHIADQEGIASVRLVVVQDAPG